MKEPLLPNPSLATLTTAMFLFLFYAVVLSFQSWPAPLRTQFQTRNDPTALGFDFGIPRRAVDQLLRKEKIYTPSKNSYPNYDYVPQSLFVMLPFSHFSPKGGYYFLVIAGFAAIFLMFLRSAQCLARGNLPFYVLFFPALVLTSQAGLLLFDRGNLDILGAFFIYSTFLALLCRREKTAAFFLAFATCVKPVYGPFFIFLFLLKDRWRCVMVYVLVHVAAVGTLTAIYGTHLFTDYLHSMTSYVEYVQEWTGDANISFLSLLATLNPTQSGWIMTLTSSVVVFFALCALGIFIYGLGRLRKGGLSDEEMPIFFVFFMYATVLWQSLSFSYISIILLLAAPISDFLFSSSSSKSFKFLLLAHAVLLGFIFCLDRRHSALIGFKAPYYFAAFMTWTLVLLNYRLRKRA